MDNLQEKKMNEVLYDSVRDGLWNLLKEVQSNPKLEGGTLDLEIQRKIMELEDKRKLTELHRELKSLG